DLDAEGPDPLVCLERNVAREDRGAEQHGVHEARGRHERRDVEDARAHGLREGYKENCCDPEHREDREHWRLPHGRGRRQADRWRRLMSILRVVSRGGPESHEYALAVT